MIVVMEKGYAVPHSSGPPPWQQDIEAFAALLTQDLVPMIDATYRTLSDREHRALAGLSCPSGPSSAPRRSRERASRAARSLPVQPPGRTTPLSRRSAQRTA